MNEQCTFRQMFELVYGSAGEELRVFFAPGRVNLIGEHTDYTGGYVFPASLTYGTWAIVKARKDGKFRLASTAFDLRVEVDRDRIEYRREDDWANYPKGIISQFQKLGYMLSGCDILFHGNVPNGAGLSSSASIELVTAIAMKSLNEIDLPRVDLVKLSQRAENQFVGVNCGIMDQFAVGLGKANHAILLKCDTLHYQYAPLLLGDYRLVIANTNKRRELAESKYNDRRSECEEGFTIIQRHLPTAACLGDVTVDQWDEVKSKIDSKRIQNRLQHVVFENDRVIASYRTLEAHDVRSFGQFMIQSHESLRDLYEVTGPELDTLFAAAMLTDGCIGARMTGAGFGGCTVNLVHRDALCDFQLQVAAAYQNKTGLIPAFYVCDIGDGARELTGGEDTWLF